MDIIIVLLGFVGCGAIASAIYFFFSRDGKSKILKKVHDTMQKIGKDKLTGIVKSQNEVKISITAKEKISKESVNKIKDIQKKAVEDIENVLKEENIGRIHEEINNDWEEL